jgi:predicted secreted hydrolase
MRNNRKAAFAIFVAIFLTLRPIPAQFKPALPGYRYEFPRDYFNHPDYQTEWWYYTGNLQSPDGHRFGFELTFFRSGVSRDPGKGAVWDVRDLYLAHSAVSDLDRKTFFHAERTNRAGPGIAGADSTSQRVWNGNWIVTWIGGNEILEVVADQFAVNLSLKTKKPPVIHGAKGISQKSDGEGRASHYFSETRLQASGSLEIAAKKYAVTGFAWMDHEFFTEQLAADQAGWDWLSLQLDDNTELMLFHIRKKNGSIDPHSAGTFVDAQGRSIHLAAQDFQLEPTGDIWTSPATDARYPISWKIRVPLLGIVLNASTPLSSQELVSGSKLAPNYWEGAIFLTGSKRAALLSGAGYLEMTGYHRPVQLN